MPSRTWLLVENRIGCQFRVFSIACIPRRPRPQLSLSELLRSFLNRNPDATLMAVVSLLRRVGNRVYEHAFPIYRLCYRAFKIYTDRAERKPLRSILSRELSWVDAGANIAVYSSFSLAVLVRQAWFIHSSLRRNILGACSLPRATPQTSAYLSLQSENPAEVQTLCFG